MVTATAKIELYPSESHTFIHRSLWLYWTSTGHDFYEQYPERVNVALRRQLIGPHIFWVQVTYRAFYFGGYMGLVSVRRTEPRESKICNFSPEIVRQ